MNEIKTSAELPGLLYVAGPMSGLPDYNYPAFNYAAGELRVAGFEVENPADNTVESDDYHDYLRAGLAQLERCGGVAVLEGWWLSGGARWEVQTAGVLGLPVRSVDEWLKLASPDAPARTEPTEEQVAAEIERFLKAHTVAPRYPWEGSGIGVTPLELARAVLALLPQRVAPSEEEVQEAVFSALRAKRPEESGVVHANISIIAARAILALFASQPTVAEVRAQALKDAADAYPAITRASGGRGSVKAWLRARAERGEA